MNNTNTFNSISDCGDYVQKILTQSVSELLEKAVPHSFGEIGLVKYIDYKVGEKDDIIRCSTGEDFRGIVFIKFDEGMQYNIVGIQHVFETAFNREKYLKKIKACELLTKNPAKLAGLKSAQKYLSDYKI